MARGAPKISRRQALGLAAAGAVGAAGFRLFGPHLGSDVASSAGPGGAWASPLGQRRALAAHLLRRAGFGYTGADLDHAASLSYSDLVDSILAQKPQTLPMPQDVTSYRAVAQGWLAHMASTPSQFPERMTLFWHGHLTSDYRKAARLPYVYLQNLTYRAGALGDLRTLLVRATTDPLMMRYLDLDLSTGAAPNENFSRELMELFTLGVGNYTEDDVRAAAKAFAGLRIAAFDRSGARVPMPQLRIPKGGNREQAVTAYYTQIADLIASGTTLRGAVDPTRAYDGTLTFLGTTGRISATDAIDIILAKPQVATFIATKALTYFVSNSPSPALIGNVAAAFRNSHYDITTLMRSIFMSDEFRSGAAYRALVRSPVDYAVAAMRALGTDLSQQAMAAGPGMDQMLYDPPTVAGWPTNAAWLSSSSVLARINFAATAASMAVSPPSAVTAVADQLDGVVGPDFAAVFNASGSDTDRWYALLASPEFQLK